MSNPEIPPVELREATPNHNPFHEFVNADSSLSSKGMALVDFTIRLLNHASFSNSDAHGWYEQYWRGTSENPKAELGQRNFGEVMMLINSEVAEAFEAYRDGDDQTRIKYLHKNMIGGEFLSEDPVYTNPDTEQTAFGKPEGIAAELADVLIRVFDYAGAYNVPLSQAIIEKHHYNVGRSYRHGGKKA